MVAAIPETVPAVAAARPVAAMAEKAVTTAVALMVLAMVAMVAVTVVMAVVAVAVVAARPSLASSRVKAPAIHRAVSLQVSQETPTPRHRASNTASRATMTSTTSSQPATPLQASLHPANPPAATATTSAAVLAPAAAAQVALLAGATGLVGRAVLARLLADKPGHHGSGNPGCSVYSTFPTYSAVHCVGRRAPAQQHPRLSAHLVDSFNNFTAPPADDVFIALGTTLKVAGSREAFRAIDFEAVLAMARAGHAAGATLLAVVSAMGADSQSSVCYNRVKGEMEDAVRQLGFQTVVIARPSLLAGDRASLKQAPRLGEQWVLRVAKWLNPLLPANYRSVEASQVANALIDTLQSAGAGQHLLLSGAIRRYPKILII
jgi:nucleoside-diphosphate-sugar epimerase